MNKLRAQKLILNFCPEADHLLDNDESYSELENIVGWIEHYLDKVSEDEIDFNKRWDLGMRASSRASEGTEWELGNYKSNKNRTNE